MEDNFSAWVGRCGSYDSGEVERAVAELFAWLLKNGFRAEDYAGKTVVVKPNLLLARRPEEATTTHPAIVAAVCRTLSRAGANVVIAESGGGPYTAQTLKNLYEKTGIADAARVSGAELNFDTSDTEVVCRDGRTKKFRILAPVASADALVTIGKLKTHGLTVTSGAVKNLYGTIPGLIKVKLHSTHSDVRDFASMLVDLERTVRPELSIIDGVVGMEGQGPSGGSAKKTGVLIASVNPYACDAACAAVMGINPREVPVLAEAARRGLVPKDFSVPTAGGGMKNAHYLPARKLSKFVSILPGFMKEPVDRLLKPYPYVGEGCVGCGKCAESCPEKAIKIVNRKAVFDHYRCIRCYCCHEMCPKKAIILRRKRIKLRRA